jgi:hypothetical protein
MFKNDPLPEPLSPIYIAETEIQKKNQLCITNLPVFKIVSKMSIEDKLYAPGYRCPRDGMLSENNYANYKNKRNNIKVDYMDYSKLQNPERLAIVEGGFLSTHSYITACLTYYKYKEKKLYDFENWLIVKCVIPKQSVVYYVHNNAFVISDRLEVIKPYPILEQHLLEYKLDLAFDKLNNI